MQSAVPSKCGLEHPACIPGPINVKRKANKEEIKIEISTS